MEDTAAQIAKAIADAKEKEVTLAPSDFEIDEHGDARIWTGWTRPNGSTR